MLWDYIQVGLTHCVVYTYLGIVDSAAVEIKFIHVGFVGFRLRATMGFHDIIDLIVHRGLPKIEVPPPAHLLKQLLVILVPVLDAAGGRLLRLHLRVVRVHLRHAQLSRG